MAPRFRCDGGINDDKYIIVRLLGLLGMGLFSVLSQLYPFTCTRICTRVPNLFPIGPAVWHPSHMFECVTTSLCPSGIKGLMFSSCPFPDEYAYVCQRCSRSVQLFGFFLTFVNLCPLTPSKCSLGLEGLLFFRLCLFTDESV